MKSSPLKNSHFYGSAQRNEQWQAKICHSIQLKVIASLVWIWIVVGCNALSLDRMTLVVKCL